MRYQKGDEVVIRKDLKVGKKYGEITWLDGMEYMKSMLFTTILAIPNQDTYLLDTGWCISEEMISHKYEEEPKYIWYIEDSNVTYYLAKGHNHKISPDFHLDSVKKHTPSAFYLEKVFKGEVEQALLTEEEARQSVFFHTLKKHTPPPKEQLYYVCVPTSTGNLYMNYLISEDVYYAGSIIEDNYHRTKFTEEEANKIIGTSTVLYKKEVE